MLEFENTENAKSFLKWAGGKGQLLNEIRKYYPFNEEINKYAEPFVGGGAVLFDILNRYKLNEIYISDINIELINTYCAIRDNVEELIKRLAILQDEYSIKSEEERRLYFYEKRDRFNEIELNLKSIPNIEKATLMIFLNRTCFNGLFRVNKKGLFNVPSGKYKNPLICDSINLNAVSRKLKGVRIVCADYKKSAEFIDSKTFVYFDPPYRPLSVTSSFTAYSENQFSDKEQKELAEFVHYLDSKGARIIVSNSDPKNTNIDDNFFDEIYSDFKTRRVEATRMINSDSSSRGKIKELLISNF